MEEVQATIDEIANKLTPAEAKALQVLRRREEDLKAKELLEAATIQANAARDSDSDGEANNEQGKQSTVPDTILKPPVNKPQEAAIDNIKSINLKHNNIQPLQPYHGKGDEDWPKFKNKLITHFTTMELTDEQAALQFCAYVEGNAYRVWEGLSPDTKKNFSKTLRAFDRHYYDEEKHGYWRIKYENLKYPGPAKESLDDLAILITECVNRAYPDYVKKGVNYSQHAIRKVYIRKKFWELMPKDIQRELFIHFGVSDAPLRAQLERARKIQTADSVTNKEDQPYEALCSSEATTTKYLTEISQKNQQTKSTN